MAGCLLCMKECGISDLASGPVPGRMELAEAALLGAVAKCIISAKYVCQTS